MSKRRAHYCVRIANDICTHIAMGHTLDEALKKVGHLAPSIPLFWRWLDEYPDFKDKYERARQMQADMHADTMLGMVGKVMGNPSLAPAVRVAVDILKWQAEIRDAAKYGKKMELTERKQKLNVAELRKEVQQLSEELGIKILPGMDTAKRQPKSEVIDVEATEVPRPQFNAPQEKP